MQKAKLIYDIKFDEWVMSYPKRWHETRSLFYDALELENKEEKKAILIYKQLLNELHNCDLDSYTHYGTFLKQKKRIYEGKSLISRAYVLALNAIPADYYDKPGKIIWAHIDNRPLLRTYHFAGLDFEEDGFYKQAERLYKFILRANPNDNQGIRYLLASIYIKQEDFKSFYSYCEKQEDYGLDGALGLIYADFKTNKIKSAIRRLHEFYIHYPLLVEEILSDKHIEPKSIEYELEYASPGSIEEAYDYYKRTSIVWENNPDFIEFLMNNKKSK